MGDRLLQPGWNSTGPLFIEPPLIPTPNENAELPIPDFVANTPRRFRIQFGWDWWKAPGSFTSQTPVENRGDGRFFLRLWYLDNQGVWQNPHDDPAVTGQIARVNYGWAEFPGKTNSGGGQTSPDKFAWDGLSSSVYPYFTAEETGTNPTYDVDWIVDNVSLWANRPLPASIICNTLAYDTNAPQWAWLVLNDDAYRSQLLTVTPDTLLTVGSVTLECCSNPP